MTTPEFEDWLRATEFPVDAKEDIEAFKSYLEDELGIHGGSLDVAETVFKRDLTVSAEHGIRGIIVTYPWGVEVRYAVQGLAGLWGYDAVQRIRAEEDW